MSGTIADKPARMVSESEPMLVEQPRSRFVSRGGNKLDAALRGFGVSAERRRCLDAGSSTGGFTDCLLQQGAARVVAVDVAKGAIDSRLREDRRLVLLEAVNVRHLALEAAGGEPFDLVVADLSFISLTVVARVLLRLARPGADLVVLVKPQFEVGREVASRGRGVVRDDPERRKALGVVASAFVAEGACIMGAMASPLLGPAGNAEFFLHVKASAAATSDPASPAPPAGDLDEMLDAAVAQAPRSHLRPASARTGELPVEGVNGDTRSGSGSRSGSRSGSGSGSASGSVTRTVNGASRAHGAGEAPW